MNERRHGQELKYTIIKYQKSGFGRSQILANCCLSPFCVSRCTTRRSRRTTSTTPRSTTCSTPTTAGTRPELRTRRPVVMETLVSWGMGRGVLIQVFFVMVYWNLQGAQGEQGGGEQEGPRLRTHHHGRRYAYSDSRLFTHYHNLLIIIILINQLCNHRSIFDRR